MYFILYFDRTIAEGDVTLKLRRVGSDTVHASHIYHYRPITGEWSITSNFAIPDHGLVAADDYFLEAVHAAGNTSLSPVFSISLRGSTGLISFLKPAGRAVFNPGMQMHVDFQFNRPAADGLVRLDMFALGSHRPVLSWTSPYHTPARGTPQPIYTRELRLPDDLPFSNNYFIQATHAEGSGRSENFVISPLITRGGREVVDDIAVTDIFPDSRSTVTKARIRVTGAHYPLWVVWRTTARWTPTSILLYPGDNEVTIDDPGFRGEDGTCSLDYVVQLDPDNLYAETDETNNNLEKTIFIWGRNGRLSVRDLGFANTKYISCDPDSNLAVIFVVQYCGTASFESDWVQSLRQSGRLNGENFDREVEYEIYVSDRCGPGNLGDRLDHTVQPGQCILIRVWRNALLRADGDLTLRLAEPVASWRGITSPITVHLKFGMRDVITGTCVYNP